MIEVRCELILDFEIQLTKRVFGSECVQNERRVRYYTEDIYI